MSKRFRTLELKHSVLLESRVFEDGGRAPEEAVFTFRDLKRWGFDLFSGKRNDEAAWFLDDADAARQAGDRFQTEAGDFEIGQRHDALPEDTRLVGRLAMREGRAMLALSLEGGVNEEKLAEIPAGELLAWYLGKEGLFRILAAIRNAGTLAMLECGHGQEGKAQSLEEMPAVFRRVLREARKLGRDIGAGRIALTGFGQARDGRWRYRMSWELPTLALFDRDTAERIDKLLETIS